MIIYDKIKYCDGNGQEQLDANKMGFWLDNHSLNITYTHPFYTWFLKGNNEPSYTKNMDFTRSDANLSKTVEQAAQEAFDSLKLIK